MIYFVGPERNIPSEVYKQATRYRESFIKKSLQKVIDKIDGAFYSDFNQDKND